MITILIPVSNELSSIKLSHERDFRTEAAGGTGSGPAKDYLGRRAAAARTRAAPTGSGAQRAPCPQPRG